MKTINIDGVEYVEKEEALKCNHFWQHIKKVGELIDKNRFPKVLEFTSKDYGGICQIGGDIKWLTFYLKDNGLYHYDKDETIGRYEFKTFRDAVITKVDIREKDKLNIGDKLQLGKIIKFDIEPNNNTILIIIDTSMKL
jgi:hypothetical protein